MDCLTPRHLSAMLRSRSMCDLGHTCGEKNTRSEMNYLSDVVVNQRPMFQVAGEIILAFCCATPLVLLLCFLV